MAEDPVVRVLKAIPAKRLLLLDLAWELVGEDGLLAPNQVAFRAKELQEARNEADVYRQATERAVWALKRLIL